MAKTRKLPIVDDADVQRIADLFLTIPNPAVSDEDLVKHADEAALACAYAWGNTAAWRRELVRRVRDRVQFALMARRRSQPSKWPRHYQRDEGDEAIFATVAQFRARPATHQSLVGHPQEVCMLIVLVGWIALVWAVLIIVANVLATAPGAWLPRAASALLVAAYGATLIKRDRRAVAFTWVIVAL